MPIVIVGIGGHGRELLDIVEAVNALRPKYDFLGFLDDLHPVPGSVRNSQVLGKTQELDRFQAEYAIGVGSPYLRRCIDASAMAAGRNAATLIHPSATSGSEIEWGPGTVMAAGSHITTRVKLGRHVHLNVGATVSHDCELGNYVSLSPGVHLSGDVLVGDQVFFGTGAVVRPGCNIGEAAVVGAGAVVIGDVAPGQTVAGVPARPIKGKGDTTEFA